MCAKKLHLKHALAEIILRALNCIKSSKALGNASNLIPGKDKSHYVLHL